VVRLSSDALLVREPRTNVRLVLNPDPQTIVNNNQNTTYNFGGDVVNNNWITNNIYLTKEEVCGSCWS